MLSNKRAFHHQAGVVIVMTDIAIVAASVKTTLLEIAKQASALGVGLQNAAPGDKTGTPNKSVQYLLEASDHMTEIAAKCEKLKVTTTAI